MKREVIPAVLAKNADEALDKIQRVPSAAWIQLDCMDGKFVKNETWFDARTVARWDLRKKIELHLMVRDPERVIRDWKRVPSFKRALWHIEAPVDHARVIRLCRRLRIEPGLAINPGTPLAALIPFIRLVKEVLVMGVQPGWSGQKLVRSTLSKAQTLHKLAPRLPIGFDGGVTPRNVATVHRRGVTRICVASALFKQRDPDAVLRALQKG